MLSIQQLREKRAAKAKEYRKILDDAGDKFTKDDHGAKLAALQKEIDDIDEQIAAIENALRLEAETANPSGATRLPGLPQSGDRDTEVFQRWLRNGLSGLSADDMEHVRSRPKADQSASEGTKGGWTVPKTFSANLLERLAAYGGMRNVATVEKTENGRVIEWPTTDETAEEGELVAENQQVGSGEVTFGTKSIGAHKYSSKVIVVPWELLQDTAIDIVGFINRALTARLGRITNKHFTTGDDINKPNGIVTAAGLGKTTTGGQTTTLIYEDFVDLEHSVDPAYRNQPGIGWMFHDNTLKALKKLKDSTGRPLWLPGLSSADPDTFLRYPYTINQHMASSIAASAKTVLFGNFKKYLIRDVMDVTLFRFDDSRYAEKGQVGFLAFMRSDGDLIDVSNDAVKYIQQAAS